MQTTIHSLDYEARGVARVGGKTVFVQGALPLETVRIRITQEKASFALADTEAVIEASPFRVQAACAHYGECGGCALQHADFAAQVAYKQRVFEEQLQRIGKVQPAVYLPPIYGNAWGYRSRTRLSVHITREGEVRLGYQAKHSHRIVPVSQCPVLPPHVSGSLHLIREMLQQIHDQMPKNRLTAVDICVGEAVTACSIQCSRPLPEPITHQTAERLQQHSGTAWQIGQQCQKQPAQAIAPKNAPELYYTLPEFNLHMPFRVGDFTQINLPMNAQMVARAVRLLDPQPHERIADLFCGLGNFTLPLARSGARIVGIEGADSLTRRAQRTAQRFGQHRILHRRPVRHAARHRGAMGAFRQNAARPAARRRLGRGAKPARTVSAAAYRICVVQSRHAGARCRRAGRQRLRIPRRRHTQPVSAHRPHRSRGMV